MIQKYLMGRHSVGHHSTLSEFAMMVTTTLEFWLCLPSGGVEPFSKNK